jgi:hypothetical protein
MRNWLISLFIVFTTANGYSQVVKSVVLDEVMIQAVKKGFDIGDFVNMVKSDTSFLRGFRSLRNTHHLVEGNMSIYGKKDKVKATRYRKAIQVTKDNRRWIAMLEEKVTGDFYNRKEEPETYTAELFDDIFFYKDTLPVLPPSQSISAATGTNNSGNISKLKKLVFNPGAEIDGVPVVGKRMAIFDDDMVKYYDYAITSKTYNDTVNCYVFSCIAKPDAGDYPVLKYMNTWFDRMTLNIVYRDYHYLYRGLLFDFNVTMRVTMNYDQGILYPSIIEYTGFWDVPLHKKEKVEFNLDFKLLKIN